MFKAFQLPALQSLLAATLICTTISSASADNAALKATAITESIHLITGKGGNIGVSVGADGTFMIDDKFADLGDSIVEQLKSIGGDIPKFVINTHWHGDHTGSNLNFGQQGSIIVAHDNVRKRLSQDSFIAAFDMKTSAYPAAGLPVVTFTDEIRFHLNNDNIAVTHIANAHTDGDSVIYFQKANVLHAGDLFFNGFYPFIDIDHGGSLKGMINGADRLLSMINDETKIIPGHGPMANKKDLQAYRDMLNQAYQQLSELKKSGKNLLQAIAAKPLQSLDAEWSDGLFKTDKWIAIIYDGLD